MPAIIQHIEDVIDDRRRLPHDFLSADAGSGAMTSNASPGIEAIVRIGKKSIQMPDFIQGTHMDNQCGSSGLMDKNRFRIG